MALVVEQPIATFDLSEIARGDLAYGYTESQIIPNTSKKASNRGIS